MFCGFTSQHILLAEIYNYNSWQTKNDKVVFQMLTTYHNFPSIGGSSATSSVNNSDSGIGGATVIPPRSHLRHTSQGTLDVSRPSRSHKSNHHKPLKSKTQSNSKENQEKGKTLSSLDALISQTSPELTAHQRLKLRKSSRRIIWRINTKTSCQSFRRASLR